MSYSRKRASYRIVTSIREAMSLLGVFMAIGVLLGLIPSWISSYGDTYRLMMVAEDLSWKLALAKAQAEGFGIPFSVQLPGYEVVCDGEKLTLSSGNITVSVKLVSRVSPFQANGGRALVYPNGDVHVET